MNSEVEQAWLHVERELGKRYPTLHRLFAKLKTEEVPEKAVAEELHRLARDLSDLNHQVAKYRRLSPLLR